MLVDDLDCGTLRSPLATEDEEGLSLADPFAKIVGCSRWMCSDQAFVWADIAIVLL